MSKPLILAVLALSFSSAVCDGSAGVEPPISGLRPGELAQWQEAAHKLGASKAEWVQFEGHLVDLSAESLPKVMQQLRTDPDKFFAAYVTGLRRERPEDTPKPLFHETLPILPCERLRQASIENATIDSSITDPVDGSCRVTAIVTHPPAADRVKVFIALPTKGWNGRFRGTGGAGYLGGRIGNLRVPVARGYAAGATDSGHEGNSAKFVLDASGRLDWQAIRDDAYLGIHEMTRVGKALTLAFYGKAPRYSYFVAGSTGGRQALMEAQRYPEDYDGIVALFPAIYRNRYVPAQLWPQLVMLEMKDFLPPAKFEAVNTAVVAACGDEHRDIEDPTRCTYDPKALVGKPVGDTPFTETDAEVIRRIWEGPRAHDGTFLWFGLTRGTSFSSIAATGDAPATGKPTGEVLDWFRYYLHQGPDWDWTTLSRGQYELLWNQSVEEYGAVIGTDDPDLARFRDRGGKLIVIHGWADEIVPAQGSIEYFRRVRKQMGGAEQTARFARLFLVPGAGHGSSFHAVAAPSMNELLAAIIGWVEGGRPPERMIAELRDASGTLIRARTLLPYAGTDQ